MSDPGARDVWNDALYHNIATPGGTTNLNSGNQFVNNHPAAQDQYLTQQQSQSPSSQPGNYTMLSVGHGNYVKVYHNSDESEFTKYELFSSKSFMINQQQQNHGYSSQVQASPPPQPAPVNNDGVSPSTSLFLNQLVGNLGSQNLSGTYSPFGGPSASPPLNSHIQNNFSSISPPIEQHATGSYMNQVPQEPPLRNIIKPNPLPRPVNVQEPIVTPSNHHVDLNNFTTKSKISEVVKKPRIVAEVKPMRMSYSDVLSQNVSIGPNESNSPIVTGVMNANNNTANTPIKSTKSSSDKSKSSHGGNNNNNQFKEENRGESFNGNRSSNSNKKSSSGRKSANEITSMSAGGLHQNDKDKKSFSDEIKDNSATDDATKHVGINNNNMKKRSKSNKDPRKPQNQNSDVRKIRRSQQIFSADLDDEDDDDEEDDSVEENESNENCYYNITTTYSQVNNIEKISQSRSKNRNSTRNSSNTSANAASSSSSTVTTSAGGGTTRPFNQKYEKTYKRSQKSRRNRQYVFMVKFLEKWWEYMMKLLTWLLSLVSDVVVLSLGIVWDRLNLMYQHCVQSIRAMRNELKTNSGFSTEWFKRMYKKIDMKFGKNSKWAVWRKIFCKKKIAEPVSDFYKNGRLPQTGDEAMYSLLNCKGKDAYSILGVAPDCSQEQIRKHYKKIAVLVHPDKNKQPGAEEAFKILQRAFELIGEPENRKSYDQSVAEALNAEKAWSELNDLLTQLHTKIAEAANTIRCSSCGLRHPRKPTGRPHYAARECNSCKIRHSAREGDIWAETSFFGLRWKYLALMEGTVYDITEWANCQKGALSHLQPNSHIVQYRIVLGGQQQQAEKEKAKKNVSANEPNLDDFLNNLYGGPNQQPQSSTSSSSRRRSKKN